MAVGRRLQVVTVRGTVTGTEVDGNEVVFSGDAVLVDLVRLAFEFVARSEVEPDVLAQYDQLPQPWVQAIYVLDTQGRPDPVHHALVLADPPPDAPLAYAALLESLSRIANGQLHPEAVSLSVLERSYQHYQGDQILRKVFDSAVQVIVAHAMQACDALLAELAAPPSGRSGPVG